jgi:DNA (cytosine-5)-methyltransferase 1
VAGLRRSLDDARGNLSLTFCEIADAIDHVRAARGDQPCVVFWENVPGVLSTKDNAFGCFLAGLAGEDEPLVAPGGRWANAGAVFGPARAVAWRTLDAQHFGLAQRRRRVFVVASARDGFDPAQVLFEWDGLRRDTAPRRSQAEDVAPTAIGGAQKRGGLSYDDIGLTAFGGNRTSGPIDVSPALNACGTASGRQDFESEAFITTTHTLRGEGFDASEDGTGRGTPLVPVAYSTKLHNTQSNQAGKVYEEYATSLDANSPPPAVFQPVAFDTTQVASAQNRSNPQPGDPCHPLAIAFHPNQDPISSADVCHTLGANDNETAAVAFQSSQSGVRLADAHATLDANNGPRRHNGAVIGMQVRRLTPRECERLQGFPDDYTLIPWRKRPASECPDGPRYKAMGNSWAVPVVRWIGARIAAHIAANDNNPRTP